MSLNQTLASSLKENNKENPTPLMAQYEKIKNSHPEEIVLFRLGDFYEMFGEDAKKAAPILEVVLTQRQGNPMCGIPYHALNRYLSKLLKSGLRVAIAEQLEDPSQVKGIVKRDIVRVISSGTIIEENLLEEKTNNFLLALSLGSKTSKVGLAGLDISTGEWTIKEIETDEDDAKILNEISLINPAEILIHAETKDRFPNIERIPIQFFDPQELNLNELDLDLKKKLETLKIFPEVFCAVQMAIGYTQKMNPAFLKNLQTPALSPNQENMTLDKETIENLEILKNRDDGTSKKTLLEFLDQTLTAMGGRLLKNWLLAPLIKLEKIQSRIEVVDFFKQELNLRKKARETLKGCSDLERLMVRVSSKSVGPRDLLGLKFSLLKIEKLKKLALYHSSANEEKIWLQNLENKEKEEPHISSFKNENSSLKLPKEIETILNEMEDESDLISLLQNALEDDPPIQLEQGGAIRNGYNSHLDEKRAAANEGKIWLQNLESKEKEATHISTLKVGYTSIFGYYLEVTKSHLSKVPQHWHRKQTLINTERFINEELKSLEEKILGAEEQAFRIEKKLFQELILAVEVRYRQIQKSAKSIAKLDCFLSLAEVADLKALAKPQVEESDELLIKDGWHPIVKESLAAGAFVPNDTFLNSKEHQIIILTGPNMAGKSTYLRQNALIALMAQIGSFVPAKELKIGSGDKLAQGESTFMVEMRETSKILKESSEKSLIILDEVGRGTSTYDGISIAWATIEYLSQKKAKVLFATHYFELTKLASEMDQVKNYNVEAKEWKDTVLFLHKIVPGPADRSYGIHVAQLAGLPNEIILRAKKILNKLEQERISVLYSNQKELNQPELFK